MKKYWNEWQECMNLKAMRKWQLTHLTVTLSQVYKRVPFYREKFKEAGIGSEDIIFFELEDLVKFPFTVKNDLRDNYPFGLCAVSMSELVRIHASSGTTGKPITGLYIIDDMNQWAECMARNLCAAGIRPNDMVQNALGMGLFTGGFGFLQGADKIGCAVVPIGTGGTERQITLMKDFGATALFATPSYALTIAEKAKEMGINLKKLPLRIGVFGAEPWSDEIRKQIEARLGIKAHEAYGLTELMGPGVAFSCYADGKYTLHINEDHVYPEIIDPDTKKVLPLGEKGELVLTSLQRRAMPMIRYRTKDITTLHRERCACGRTLVTMDRVKDRSDDMKIVNGVNIFPSQIEDVVMKSGKIEPLYQIYLKKGVGSKKHLDVMIVKVEAREEIYQAGEKKIKELEKELASRIKDIIGIGARVEVVKQGELPRSTGKAKRLIDERGQQ